VLKLYTTLHVLAFSVSDRMKALKEDERGASAMEYALLVGLIAVAVVAAVAVFGTKLKTLFDGVEVNPKAPASGGTGS
jgi:pilus assembly protein Flp/PilA